MTRRFAPAAVGTAAGSLLVAASGLASPIVAFAGLAGLTVVGLILAFPYWGFLLTAAVVPMERIGRRGVDGMKATLLSLATWPARRLRLTGGTAVVAGPFVWLLLFFFVPFLLVVKISFAELQLGIPPYTELVAFKDGVIQVSLNVAHYAFLFTDSLYFATYVNSMVVAAVTTLFCLLLCYPIAY